MFFQDNLHHHAPPIWLQAVIFAARSPLLPSRSFTFEIPLAIRRSFPARCPNVPRFKRLAGLFRTGLAILQHGVVEASGGSQSKIEYCHITNASRKPLKVLTER